MVIDMKLPTRNPIRGQTDMGPYGEKTPGFKCT